MEFIFQFGLDAILLVGLVAFICLAFMKGGHIRIASVIGAVLLTIALIGALGVVIVPAGNVGVVKAFGAVQNDTLSPGFHFRVPFVNSVSLIDTRVQAHQFQEIDAASKEYQSVKLTGVMNYHIDGQYASDLVQRVTSDLAATVIDPAFNDFIKAVVPTYSINDILNKRDEIRTKAKTDLQANLSQYHIIVDDIYISNISFSDAYQQAIESKQVAQQQVETEKQLLAQKQIQAQQAVVSAQGQADANVVTAQGQAKANQVLTQSLTPALIQYTLINKLAPTIQTMILPAGQNFILDPNALLKTPAAQ